MTRQQVTGRHPARVHRLARPVSFLNPTEAYVAAGTHETRSATNGGSTDAKPGSGGDEPTASVPAAGAYQLWRSRDNRKGRHAVVIPENSVVSHPRPTNSLQSSLHGVIKMFVTCPAWDVSYDVAVIFTIGCVIWVLNGFFVWLPVQDPWTEFAGEVDYGGGITAFIGATVFEIGSVLLMLEAVNENRTQCFGWALENALEDRRSLLRPDPGGCSHHHPKERSLLGPKSLDDKEQRSWMWWPSWSELKTHYFKEIGFLACLSQFIGATIFWIAGFTGLPPIYDGLTVAAANGAYWLPQVVGGSGFIISSWLFMLETQRKWYVPAPAVLGWHIGFWNLIGALGFTICGALGFASDNTSAAYSSLLSTFIGSWAFLIGSVIQWFESLNKYPVMLETMHKVSDKPTAKT